MFLTNDPFIWYDSLYGTTHGARFIDEPNQPFGLVETTNFSPATVIEAAINYVGSISLPTEWFEKGYVLNGQLVATMRMDFNAGADRKSFLDQQLMYTYAIREPDETFTGIRANGGAAQRIHPGDKVIISCFGYTTDYRLIDWINESGFFSSIEHVCLNQNNRISDVNTDKDKSLDPEKLLIPMYAGKLHRIIPLPVPDDLKTLANNLDLKNEYTMLIDGNLAQAAGFLKGSTVDFLMVYKNFRQSVRVRYCDVPGHMSLHGGDPTRSGHSQERLAEAVNDDILPQMLEKDGSRADPNTTVVIGYKLLPYEKALEYSQSITEDGFPNLVIFNSQETAQSIQDGIRSNVLDPDHCSRDVRLSIGDMRTDLSWGEVNTR
jgi:aspartate 1-decarboxylase